MAITLTFITLTHQLPNLPICPPCSAIYVNNNLGHGSHRWPEAVGGEQQVDFGHPPQLTVLRTDTSLEIKGSKNILRNPRKRVVKKIRTMITSFPHIFLKILHRLKFLKVLDSTKRYRISFMGPFSRIRCDEKGAHKGVAFSGSE